MSYYTAAIQTQIIDPQFNQSKYRTEFRITEDGLYSSKMRILNLGVLASDTSFQRNREYNYITGIGGVVKNIYLYDDKTVLDQVLNYKDYGAFKNLVASNSDNMDVKKNLKKTGLGFVYDTEVFTASTSTVNTVIKLYNPETGGHIPNTSEDNSPAGYLDLLDVFPLLKSLEFLPTSIFKKLRVVIEYDVNGSLVKDTDVSPNVDIPTSTLVPILLVDKIVDEPFISKWVSEFKGVSWNCVENENVTLPTLTAPPASGVQSVKYRLNGFNNKTLGNLLMQKKASTYVSNLYLNNGSASMANEAMQVYVNGSALLPDSGVLSSNHRLGLLTDTFGNMNLYPGANIPCYPKADTSDVRYLDRVGELDYFGCSVGKKINQLEITFSRKYITDLGETYKQQLQLQFFGTVAKSLIVSKGAYQIIYV
jgi:hypothetical protein